MQGRKRGIWERLLFSSVLVLGVMQRVCDKISGISLAMLGFHATLNTQGGGKDICGVGFDKWTEC